jgi:hypothetical protein
VSLIVRDALDVPGTKVWSGKHICQATADGPGRNGPVVLSAVLELAAAQLTHHVN